MMEKMGFQVPIFQIAEKHYRKRGQITIQNRNRQDTLNLEKKFEVKKWSLRVNKTLSSIRIIEAQLTYEHIIDLRCAKNVHVLRKFIRRPHR